jgi:hypothetical protein
MLHRRAHVLLARFDRLTLFSVVYFLHMFTPVLGVALYVVCPRARLLALLLAVSVGLVQFYTRTCPIAQLEWALVPEMRTVTWRGVDAMEQLGMPSSKDAKFIYMCGSTVLALATMIAVHYALPNGVL